MKKALFILTLLWGCLSLGANILRVAIDGSQAYTVIQEAINASADTDTVLVFPGRYFENIRFYGKNITLASLELVTGNLDYKYNTILDGSQNGPVVEVKDNESNIAVRGFTITNGSGAYANYYDTTVGGGINIGGLSGQRICKVINCMVYDNQADLGGGIRVSAGNLTLSGLSIFNNSAASGGGLVFQGSTGATQFDIVFDPENRCSIYNNKAAFGSDMYFYMVNQVHVVVDTFTVANPSNFYASAIPQNSNIENPYTFDILHSVHTEINHDLYVAPWGDDANDGLSEGTPLQTIFRAAYTIASDPENPKTIHLAEGYYSRLTNNQFFPLTMKSFTRLTGQGCENTVIDFSNASRMLLAAPFSDQMTISSLHCVNCKGGIQLSYSTNITISNVIVDRVNNIYFARGYAGYSNTNQRIENCLFRSISSSEQATGIDVGQGSGDFELINTEISNCTSGTWMPTLQISSINDAEVVISGCSFHDNTSSAPDVWNSIMQIGPYSIYGQRLRVEIQNSSFFNNNQSNSGFMGYIHALNDTAFVRNCTFAENRGGSSALMVKGNAVLENNVFWNPQLPTEITAYYSANEGISGRLEFANNCIRNGLNGIYNMSTLN
ncbi:MAG: hypothetical protein PHO32_10010, partial [Candidatus Cloacimonetes bacterium]|nr:hypothetical protein [Candidatus Cloacimonadota bacterium]